MTGYADATVTRSNTLSKTSQDILKDLKGPVTVTAYTNLFTGMGGFGLPENRTFNLDEWSKYSRFIPDMRKLAYVNYYDSIDNSWFYNSEFPGLTQGMRSPKK